MALAKQIIRVHDDYADLVAGGNPSELQLYMIGIAEDTDEFIFRSDDGFHRVLDSGTAALSEHSIPFINASGKVVQDNANFNFNDGTNILTTNILTTLGNINAGADIIVADGGSITLQEDITFTGATAVNQIVFPLNRPNALSFQQGANLYQTFISIIGFESVHYGVDITFAAGMSLSIADGEYAFFSADFPNAGLIFDASNTQYVFTNGTPATLMELGIAATGGELRLYSDDGIGMRLIGFGTDDAPTIGMYRYDSTPDLNESTGKIFFGFSTNQATEYVCSAIYGRIDGAVGSVTDLPGALLFMTCPDGSNVLTTGLKIDCAQNVIIAQNLGIVGDLDLIQLTGANTMLVNGALQVTTMSVGTATNNYPVTVYHATDAVMQFITAGTGVAPGDGTYFGVDVNQRFFIWNYENTGMFFATNNATKMTLTATGNLKLGTTGPADTVAKLIVVGGAGAALKETLWLSGGSASRGSGPSIVFNDYYNNGAYPTWQLAEIGGVYAAGGSWGGAIVFLTNTGGAVDAVVEQWRITYQGHLQASLDNLYTKWGAGQDCGIMYDGTNMIYDSQLVGGGDHILKSGNVVVEKTSGIGIKVDIAAPTFGWRDILGKVTGSKGSTKPSEVSYRDGLTEFQFSDGDDDEDEFHIPHDYVAGTDIYLHVHWSHNSAIVTGGTITLTYEITYAKGHNQAAFPVTVSTTFIGTASTTQYQHIITEIQISAGTPDGNQIDSDDLEPDGIILCRLEMTTNNITSGGAVPDPFIHFVDVHYQSTNIATKQKAPNFYT